jgi:hypothetical protein
MESTTGRSVGSAPLGRECNVLVTKCGGNISPIAKFSNANFVPVFAFGSVQLITNRKGTAKASSVWRRISSLAQQNKPVEDFSSPSGVTD